jgi:hypothetical protein
MTTPTRTDGFLTRGLYFWRKYCDEPSINAKYTDSDIITFLESSYQHTLSEVYRALPQGKSSQMPIQSHADIQLGDSAYPRWYTVPPYMGVVLRILHMTPDLLQWGLLWTRGSLSPAGKGYRLEENAFWVDRNWLPQGNFVRFEFAPSGCAALHQGTLEGIYRAPATYLDSTLGASVANVMAAAAGNGQVQTFTTGITNPATPQILSVTMTGSGTSTGNITIIGTDSAGGALTDTIAVPTPGQTTIGAVTKAFKTVTSIAFPTTVTASNSVSVGVTGLVGAVPGDETTMWTTANNAAQQNMYVRLMATPTLGQLDTHPSAYAGSRIRILSATSNSLTQERTIRTYNPVTRLAMLEEPLNPIPGGTVTYEICPITTQVMDRVIWMHAAMDVLPIEGDPKKYGALKERYRDAMRDLRLFYAQRDMQQGGKVETGRYLNR